MRKHNYVVGFSGEEQIAYGKNTSGDGYIELMTLEEAQVGVQELTCPRDSPCKRNIYKLVPIEVID